MKTRKITVFAFLKNAYKLKNPSYYARVKENGKTKDIPLNTTSKDIADAWIRLRRGEIARYNDYILAGEVPPYDLLNKLEIAKKTANKPVLVREGVEHFELHLRRSGHRETTITRYLKILGYVLDMNMDIYDLTANVLKDALRRYDGLKSATRKSYCVCTREFVKFLCKEFALNRDLIDCFTFVKVHVEERGFWTMDEIKRIIDSVQCRTEEVTRAYKAYFWVLATTGARQGEAALVEWSDLRDGNLTFRAENTKTGEMRTCPLTLGVLNMIVDLPVDGKKIFKNIGNHQAARYRVLQNAVKKAGVRPGGLHTFRHSASMYLYSKISDIKLVSQILGHSPSTALKYYQATREVEKISDAITSAYEGEMNLPTVLDWAVDNDLL